jgi:hypothetical protein
MTFKVTRAFSIELKNNSIFSCSAREIIMSEETKDTTKQEPTEETQNTAEETKEIVKSPSLLRNYISFIGLAIIAASLTCIVLLFLLELSGDTHNPYLEIFTYILFPSILVFGLFIAFVGALIERRRRRTLSPEQIGAYPVLDLNNARSRRALIAFLCLSFIFLFISAFGSYRAYEFSESVTFCGQVCHTVMNPEFVAYNAAPHSEIRCVECHVGGGAEWYVRAKFNGLRQLYAVTFNTYHKPIETPVHNMRPANETCAKCHWAEKYHGEQLKIFNHYGYDKDNSLNQTRMLIKVGGGSPDAGPVSGIHWHMNIANEITYISDEKRQNISWVRMKNMNGEVVEYTAKGAQLTPQQIESSPKRKMDCIDCHNRPTHIYVPPDRAVDQALDANKLDRSLPFLKAKAVETLSKPYNTNDEAVNSIAKDLDEYYRSSHADVYSAKNDSINGAVKEVQRIYQTYFFPEMKTDWKAHPDNIGHYYSQGCFRCHNGEMTSPQGRVIRKDCNICHTTLDQSWGGKTLTANNGSFQHPVNLGDKNELNCAACHKGDRPFVHPVNLGDTSRFQCAQCHTGQNPRMDLNKLGNVH